MKKEPLYIIKIHITKFYDFSNCYMEYFMNKKQAEEKFQKEKEKILEKFSEHLKHISIKDNGNEFEIFNDGIIRCAKISLIETEVNV